MWVLGSRPSWKQAENPPTGPCPIRPPSQDWYTHTHYPPSTKVQTTGWAIRFGGKQLCEFPSHFGALCYFLMILYIEITNNITHYSYFKLFELKRQWAKLFNTCTSNLWWGKSGKYRFIVISRTMIII